MTYSGLDKKGVLVANKTTINSNENHFAPLNPYYRDFLERFIVLEEGQRVGINEIEILALKTKHSEKAIGFKFFTPYFTLSYSSDTRYFPELIEQYKNSNILILNVPHIKKEEAKNNLCIEDAIKIIREVAPRLAIIQHFGIEMVKGDLLYQIREIQKASGIQTILAKDGMVINPLSYSVDQGQRTLQSLQKLKEGERTEPKQTIVEEPKPIQEQPEEVEIIEEEVHQEELQEPQETIEPETKPEEPLQEEQRPSEETQTPLEQPPTEPKSQKPSVSEGLETKSQSEEIKEITDEDYPIIGEQKEKPSENVLESKEALKDILRED